MKLFKILSLAIGLSAISTFAQDVDVDELPTAIIADDYIITLDSEVPIQDYYSADISHLDFASLEAGQKLLNIYCRGNLVSCELLFDEGKAIVHIYTEFLGGDLDYERVQAYLGRLTKYE